VCYRNPVGTAAPPPSLKTGPGRPAGGARQFPQQEEELLILQVREKKGQTGTGVSYFGPKKCPTREQRFTMLNSERGHKGGGDEGEAHS
jgi:hypothetical protein